MCKSQRKGGPESHLANRGVGVRWGIVSSELTSTRAGREPLVLPSLRLHDPPFATFFNSLARLDRAVVK
jgi:hypothetical protein